MSLRRDLADAEALQGAASFAGGSGCHTDTLQTAPCLTRMQSYLSEPSAYTDLLHDTGTGLAPILPEGNASGAEWRTPAATVPAEAIRFREQTNRPVRME